METIFVFLYNNKNNNNNNIIICCYWVHFHPQCTSDGKEKERKIRKPLACENNRFSSLFAAEDVSRRGMSVTQRQKFHTDDIKSVRNPVKSADWTME